MGRWLLLTLLTLPTLLASPAAHAGDRQIKLMLVRADDGTDPAAKACFGRFRSAVVADYSEPTTASREAFLKKVEAPDFEDFLTWPVERFRRALPPLEAYEGWDALVVVDCRPATGRLRVVVLSGGPGIISTTGQEGDVRFDLQGATKTQVTWLIRQVMAAAWINFSP